MEKVQTQEVVVVLSATATDMLAMPVLIATLKPAINPDAI
jgi:hypothetical protein